MSIYRQATLGEPNNRITFNDFTNSPVYRVQTRAPQRFEIRDDNIPVPFESGVNDFQTLIGQTIYVIKGTMYPSSEVSYDEGIANLRAVCSLDLQQSSSYSTDSGYMPYTWEEANGSRILFVKALYVQLVEDTRQGFVQPFTIYCKIKDPTIYGATLKTATSEPSNAVAGLGSAAYPFGYPIAYGATLYTTTSSAINNGNIPCYPVSIDIYGPVTNPIITNAATGEYIQVNTTLASTSNILHIEYNNSKLAVTVGGNSVAKDVTTSSDYFKIQPGENVISLTGSSVGTGAYYVLTYRDAYALA